MIYIREIPCGDELKKVDKLRVLASGKTHEQVLKNLIVAINNDEVDDVNNFLIITEDE